MKTKQFASPFNSRLPLLAAVVLIAGHPRVHAQIIAANKPEPILADQLGAVAGNQYQGEGLSMSATPDGARLRCVFQRMEGQVTREGLWLTSTAEDSTGERFRVVAMAVGRESSERGAAPCEAPAAALPDCSTRCGWVSDQHLFGGARPSSAAASSSFSSALKTSNANPLPGVAAPGDGRASLAFTGAVEVADKLVRFIRPGLTEEYSVSMDGVRQDFIIGQRPAGEGKLRVDLDVTGAKAQPLASGARLTLDGSGRKIAYSRLRVVDAQGKKLAARLKVTAATRLAVLVDDGAAAYPVRIDPTFSDADWNSLGGLPGANGQVSAAVVDDSGNLYIGGSFTAVGNVRAANIAKWDGSAWSALGSGMNSGVSELALSGTDLYVGGAFTTAGNKGSAYAARANIGGPSIVAGGSFGSLAYSPATGLSFTFGDATTGLPYRIQSSPSLAAGSWTDFTNFTYTGPVIIIEASADGAPKKFYRSVTP